MGVANADATTRLFLVQGTRHCGGGDGLAVADWLAPLVQWLEQGATDRGTGSRLEAANWSGS